MSLKDMLPESYTWINNNRIYEWRQHLKYMLAVERGYVSDLSGKYLHQCHMHEGIITRANVPKSIHWHWKIFHPYNCFLLLPDEHVPYAPSREWCVKKAVQRYGEQPVVDWFYSLPWKVPPFRIEGLL